MSFTIYPAIDLRGGKCVRLYQGDYRQETSYGDPIAVARRWQEEGAEWIHLVDLDGAKEGKAVQENLIKEIIAAVDIPVQVGGGIRDLQTIEKYLAFGAGRVILGTAALEDQELLVEAVMLAKERLVVAIDANNGYVATNGWLNVSKVPAAVLGEQLVAKGVSRFIYTDISKDGTLMGPNFAATRSFAETTGAEVIASGGVSSVADIQRLKQMENSGVKGAIVGKALYTGAIDLNELR